jgi:hypothetical protein
MKLLATLLIAGTTVLAQRGGGGARMAPRPSSAGPPSFHRVAPAPVRVAPPVRTIIAPYPVFYGGYFYGPYTGYDTAPPAAYGYGYNDPNNAGDPNTPQNYAYDPNQPGQPQVLINRDYTPDSVNPVIHNYSGAPVQDASDQAAPPIFFLLAMKDHTIYSASAYWVQDDTLNYITTQGVHNRVSLDLVDRDFSKLLNSQRQIDFALPPAK